jgi:hypothetical protein
MKLTKKDKEEILSLLIFKQMLKKQRSEKNDDKERKRKIDEPMFQ